MVTNSNHHTLYQRAKNIITNLRRHRIKFNNNNHMGSAQHIMYIGMLWFTTSITTLSVYIKVTIVVLYCTCNSLHI